MQLKNNILLPKHLLKKDLNVLVVGDTHFPSCNLDYLEFCYGLYKTFKCNYVIHIGDIVDCCCFNYHEKHPDYISAQEELLLARHEIKKWGQVFPYMGITTGNHDRLILRKMKTAGLCEEFVKPLEQILKMPKNWHFYDHIDLNGVRYIHGDGFSGKFPAHNAMMNNRTSMVLGHCHSVSSIHFHNNGSDTIFGLSTGCGVDCDTLAMDYAKYHRNKPVLSAAVILNNGKTPLLFRM